MQKIITNNTINLSIQHFGKFQTITVSECCLIKFLPRILFEKHIYILALEMASSGNQHWANCIGTLSFPILVTFILGLVTIKNVVIANFDFKIIQHKPQKTASHFSRWSRHTNMQLTADVITQPELFSFYSFSLGEQPRYSRSAEVWMIAFCWQCIII